MPVNSYRFSCRLHGTGVVQCGQYPEITMDFTLNIGRDPGNTTVSWEVTNIDVHLPSTGRYDYALYIKISPEGVSPQTIISKPGTIGWGWQASVTTSNAGGTFTSTANQINVNVFAEGQICQDNGHWCYPNPGDNLIYLYTVDIPTYETFYTVSYDANGGKGAPEPQIKSNLSNLVLSSQQPSYPINVSYHNNPGSMYTVNRQFLGWLGSDGNPYPPGPDGVYSTNADCVMTAQYGNATFNTIAIPNQYVTLTLNANGGSVSPTSKQAAQQILGYVTDPSHTQIDYTVGQQVQTTIDIQFWPKYGNATFALSSLPVPTRSGYRFDGWYHDSACTQKVTTDISTNLPKTIYAKWTALPYKVWNGSSWEAKGPYVWKYNGSSWQKVAPIYKYNNGWQNISDGGQ